MTPSAVLFRGGWVLEEDGTTRQRRDVLVRDGVIAEIDEGIMAPDAQLVDCAGSTVMPGLIDAHVHLAMAGAPDPDVTLDDTRARVASNARELLAAGVTTARDVSGPSSVLVEVRERCAEDPSAGPQMLVCCEGIATVGGHGTEFRGSSKLVTEVDGPAEAREAVRRLARIGADWVKVMLNGADDQTELSDDELRAIVEEGRLQGIRVAAHASNQRAVALAVSCRVDSIEHGNGIDEALAAEMARTGIALVTTTYVFRAGFGCAHSHGPNPLDAFEPAVQDKVTKILAVRVADHERAIPAARDAGVAIVLGTDSVIGAIGTAADELEALTVLGLSRAEALHAGTAAGASLLGLDDRGRVDVGLRADLLVVRGRPDQDITTLQKPVLVMRAGQIVADDDQAQTAGVRSAQGMASSSS